MSALPKTRVDVQIFERQSEWVVSFDGHVALRLGYTWTPPRATSNFNDVLLLQLLHNQMAMQSSLDALMARVEQVAEKLNTLTERVEFAPCQGVPEYDAASARYADNTAKMQ